MSRESEIRTVAFSVSARKNGLKNSTCALILLLRIVEEPVVPHGAEIRRVVFAVKPPNKWPGEFNIFDNSASFSPSRRPKGASRI